MHVTTEFLSYDLFWMNPLNWKKKQSVPC